MVLTDLHSYLHRVKTTSVAIMHWENKESYFGINTVYNYNIISDDKFCKAVNKFKKNLMFSVINLT